MLVLLVLLLVVLLVLLLPQVLWFHTWQWGLRLIHQCNKMQTLGGESSLLLAQIPPPLTALAPPPAHEEISKSGSPGPVTRRPSKPVRRPSAAKTVASSVADRAQQRGSVTSSTDSAPVPAADAGAAGGAAGVAAAPSTVDSHMAMGPEAHSSVQQNGRH